MAIAEHLDFASTEFVEDPDTGQVLAVEVGAEYAKLIEDFYSRECLHPSVEPLRVRLANGSVQVRNSCVACGERVGTALPQRNKQWVEALSWQSDELAVSYTARRKAERKQLLLELARK